jgi:hypothetical protein
MFSITINCNQISSSLSLSLILLEEFRDNYPIMNDQNLLVKAIACRKGFSCTSGRHTPLISIDAKKVTLITRYQIMVNESIDNPFVAHARGENLMRVEATESAVDQNLMSRDGCHFLGINHISEGRMAFREEIIRAQTNAVNQSCVILQQEIRGIQVELDRLRSENSRILEEATVGETVDTTDHDLTVLGGDWLEAHCVLQIAALKFRIAELRASAPIEGKASGATPRLHSERENLRQQRAQLRATRAQIIEELEVMENDTRREKEELREYIRLNK